MKKIDVFTILSTLFTLWYLVTACVYIGQYYIGLNFMSLLGESIAYPIMWIATLGGLFSGESQVIIIAWLPILSAIIGALGWFYRKQKGKYFIIFPCLCLVAPLFLMTIIPSGTSIFAFTYMAIPIVSIILLFSWVAFEWLMIARGRY